MNCQVHSVLLQKILKLTQLPVRTCSTRETGIKYFGFTYYPRTEDFKDPPYEPSKLFLIRRIKSMKRITPREKESLRSLNIDGKVRYFGHINVVKNIPEINAVLWTVKHLIEIKPITYKNELPKDGDYTGTHLRLTGELIISPKLKVGSEQLQASENFINDEKHLNRTYLRDLLKKKWLNGYYGSV